MSTFSRLCIRLRSCERCLSPHLCRLVAQSSCLAATSATILPDRAHGWETVLKRTDNKSLFRLDVLTTAAGDERLRATKHIVIFLRRTFPLPAVLRPLFRVTPQTEPFIKAFNTRREESGSAFSLCQLPVAITAILPQNDVTFFSFLFLPQQFHYFTAPKRCWRTFLEGTADRQVQSYQL